MFNRQSVYEEKNHRVDTSDKKSAEEHPSSWTRTTMIIREEHLEKLKDFAYWERAHVKDLFEEIIEQFVSSRSIKPRPKERKKILR